MQKIPQIEQVQPLHMCWSPIIATQKTEPQAEQVQSTQMNVPYEANSILWPVSMVGGYIDSEFTKHLVDGTRLSALTECLSHDRVPFLASSMALHRSGFSEG